MVGKFCNEARDPYLAYLAYAKGFCDDELISITNDTSMFKQVPSSTPLARALGSSSSPRQHSPQDSH